MAARLLSQPRPASAARRTRRSRSAPRRLAPAPRTLVAAAAEAEAPAALDAGAVAKYAGAVVVEWAGLCAASGAVSLAVAKLANFAPALACKAAVFVWFVTLALRSRVFSPLDSSRPTVARERGAVKERKRPGWMPPPLAFPIIWSTIALLRGASAAIVWEASGKTLLVPAIAAFLLHLSVGDAWNHVNNVRQDLGAAVPGVLCVLASVATADYFYFKVSTQAGLTLLPSVVWISIASVLVTSIWSLNGRPPLYPVKEAAAA